MSRLVAAVLVLAVLITCVGLAVPPQLEEPPIMRIHLATDSSEPEVSSDGPCSLFPSDVRLRGRLLRKLGPVKVRTSKKGISLGTDIFPCDSIKIVPERNTVLKVEGKPYPGSLLLLRNQQGAALVNLTDLESYLLGVLGGEMPSSWPVEALKAQAIAARTYALYHQKSRASQDWDMTSTVEDQVYRGGKPAKSIQRAVTATRGIVMLHDDKPFPAFFHSTCGGETESPGIALGRPEFDFMRGTKCGYCTDSAHYKWTETLSAAQVSRQLVANGFKVGSPINRIDAPPPKKATERMVVVSWPDGETTIPVKDFRKALGRLKIKSGKFTCRKRGNFLVFTGHGLGHGAGMCQYGARGMALKKKSYDTILKTYYADVTLKKLY